MAALQRLALAQVGLSVDGGLASLGQIPPLRYEDHHMASSAAPRWRR